MPLRLPRLPRVRFTRRRIIAGSGVLVVLIALVGWAVWPASNPYTTSAQMITVQTGPSGNEPVGLDTTLFLPDSASAAHPVPAILLAHGFGGTKESVASDAGDFAARGYAVLTWTAQGFGRSGGQIHLDSPDYEVRDASRLIDWLAARPNIATNAPGDPKVAAVGGSYGGALSLMLASQDKRVDATVAMITWNDLANAFLPNSAGQGPGNGVFKKQWAGLFFGSGGRAGDPTSLLAGAGGTGTDTDTDTGTGTGTGTATGTATGTGPGTATATGTGTGTGTGNSGTGGAGNNAPSGSAGDASGAPATPKAAAGTSDVASNEPTGTAAAVPGASEGPGGIDPACGRFAKDVCAAYLDVATAGKASQSTIELLRRSSPAPELNHIKAPTLLIQGQADSLFPLSEAEANYNGIKATGTPVRVDWFTGGHDGGQGPQSDQDRVNYLTINWLDYYVTGKGDNPGAGFTFSRVSGFDAQTRRITTSGFSADAYPDSGAQAPVSIAISGPTRRVANPPDGNPAAITVLPGTGSGGLSSLLNGASLEIPGQHADFYSAPLSTNTDVVGLPKVRLLAASPTSEAVLFVKLYDVDPHSGASLPFGLAAPVRLTGLSNNIAQAEPVTVTLPGIVHRFEVGHLLRITVATSDQAYSTPVQPATYTVALPAGDAAVSLPQLTGTPIPNPEVIWRYALVGVVVLIAASIAAALIVARTRRRRRTVSVVAEYADTPLVVRGLRKEYADGFVAVSKVDFTVQRGQVVGLLGPNGAGKTTSLRVLLGLTQPSKGEILVFGHHLEPGADVLTRLGALVEGPGFLPHVTGLRNLELYWQSTGRPMRDAHFEEALEIAGLGDAVYRRVRKYSHGMKQRLAIAQAMLGLPELLVLDEPTDGLDPPQIAQMRKVLRAYATNGRAVLVSSHLLAEVEQTCTNVVVMNRGEVVADGPVDDVIGDSPIAQFDVSDVQAATTVLGGMTGIRSVTPDGLTNLVVDLNGTARTDVVAALVQAGIGVDRVVPRRRLEDAFLTLVGGDSKASGER